LEKSKATVETRLKGSRTTLSASTALRKLSMKRTELLFGY
jgi:hypothetical protein